MSQPCRLATFDYICEAGVNHRNVQKSFLSYVSRTNLLDSPQNDFTRSQSVGDGRRSSTATVADAAKRSGMRSPRPAISRER
jgi:hypothetical protein